MIWEDSFSKIDTNLRFEVPPHLLVIFIFLEAPLISYNPHTTDNSDIGPAWALSLLMYFPVEAHLDHDSIHRNLHSNCSHLEHSTRLAAPIALAVRIHPRLGQKRLL